VIIPAFDKRRTLVGENAGKERELLLVRTGLNGKERCLKRRLRKPCHLGFGPDVAKPLSKSSSGTTESQGEAANAKDSALTWVRSATEFVGKSIEAASRLGLERCERAHAGGLIYRRG
jgi:hypothetical protein